MIRTETHRYMTVPDTDIEFEFDGPPPHDESDVYVTIHGTPDNAAGYQVGWLVIDDEPFDMEWDDPESDPATWNNGTFNDFARDYTGPTGPEAFREHVETMRAKIGADRVFMLDRYSHGMDHYSRCDSRYLPDRQWDVSVTAVLCVPPDAPDPIEYADALLETWNSIISGDVWGVVVVDVDLDGTVTSEDACWGFVGHDYAVNMAKAGL
jgi:hypothetical protein